jgi:hypothetical protein
MDETMPFDQWHGRATRFDVEVCASWAPNVSYGEDYGAALRISRDYEIGRILDSSISHAAGRQLRQRAPAGDNESLRPYKDRLRTYEILARQKINSRLKGGID